MREIIKVINVAFNLNPLVRNYWNCYLKLCCWGNPFFTQFNSLVTTIAERRHARAGYYDYCFKIVLNLWCGRHNAINKASILLNAFLCTFSSKEIINFYDCTFFSQIHDQVNNFPSNEGVLFIIFYVKCLCMIQRGLMHDNIFMFIHISGTLQ